jgi:hypothetical protein
MEQKCSSSKHLFPSEDSDSHCVGYEDFYLLGYTPYSPLKANRLFGGLCRVHLN